MIDRPSRPTIVHVIDSLKRGGAETLLVSLVQELTQNYEIVLVTLEPGLDFGELPCPVLCLHFEGLRHLARSISRLRRIIRKHKPVLVHSQLFWSTVLARLATPRSTPVVFTIHNLLSQDAFSKNRASLWLERLTYRKRYTLLSVSQIALDDYRAFISVGANTHVLHNFVDPSFFGTDYSVRDNPDTLRLVAVGNLRAQKNYEFLLEVMKVVKERARVELDIYGEGNLREKLQETINTSALPVVLRGLSDQLAEILPRYDAFVMCSLYEGFGVAPAEAMAVGVPLVLNDLPVLIEMSKSNALFYPCGDVEAAADLIASLARSPHRKGLSERGRQLSREHFARPEYVKRLLGIYRTAMMNA